MKKILLVSFLFSTCALYAQTTCEMRVDAHQSATTVQRVDYCLNAPVVLDPMDNAEVIYYGVVTTPSEQDGKDEKGTAKDGYYDNTKLEVSRGYLGTRQFPAFTNDTLSESEREYQRKHLQEAKEAIAREQAEKIAASQRAEQQKAAALVQKTQAAEAQPAAAVQVVTDLQKTETVIASAMAETKTGIMRRQKKPSRKDNAVFIPEAIPVTSEHMQMVTEEAVYDLSQPSYSTAQEPVAEQEPAYPGAEATNNSADTAAFDAMFNTAMGNPQPAAVIPEQPAEQPAGNTTGYNPYYESGVAVSAPVTYDQISQQ